MDYNNLSEADLLFNDDEYLTEPELIDYAEYLYDNNINPENTELPQKVNEYIQGNKERRKEVINILNNYISDFNY